MKVKSVHMHCVHIVIVTSSLSILRNNHDPEFVAILESILFTQVNITIDITIPFFVRSLKNEICSTCNLKI